MHYVHCLCNVHNQSTAICRQILCVDIEVEYSVTMLFITTRHRYVFFCKYNAQNLVWNWYGGLSSIPFLKSSIPFHSGIFHIPYRNFCSIPYHALLITGPLFKHRRLLFQTKITGIFEDKYSYFTTLILFPCTFICLFTSNTNYSRL